MILITSSQPFREQVVDRIPFGFQFIYHINYCGKLKAIASSVTRGLIRSISLTTLLPPSLVQDMYCSSFSVGFASAYKVKRESHAYAPINAYVPPVGGMDRK